jgi:hypothetical protein
MTLKILIPEETTNYCTNPSIEVDASGWQAVGGGVTIARVLTRARFGRASLQVNTPGTIASEAGRYNHTGTIPAGPVTGSVYVRGNGWVFLRLRGNDNAIQWQTDKLTLDPHYWQRLSVTGQFAANETALTLAVRTGRNMACIFYVDGAQIELKGHVTTYCDGDRELELPAHEGDPYFEWEGQRHITRSFRSRTFRQGGKFVDMVQGLDWDLFPIEASGIGMPPVGLGVVKFSGQDRASVQTYKAFPREIGMAVFARRSPEQKDCDAASLALVRKARNALLEVLKPDRLGGVQPAILRYEDGKVPMDLEVVYSAGMEWAGDMRQASINAFALRMLAPDPYWRTDSQDVASVSSSTVPVTDHAFLIGRLTGQWDGFGSASFPVRVLAVHPNGDVYAGGDFTNIGGVACRHIARWDGTAWNILAGVGNDIDNGTVYAIAFGMDGKVYIGGTFTTIGGGTHRRITVYDPVGDSFTALDAGANNGADLDVNAIAVAKDGTVYFGGAFTSANALNCYRIAKYTPSTDTIAAIGAHDGLNLDVEAMVTDLDGSTILIGGQFTDEQTHIGGTALSRICKYTVAGGFEAIGEVGLNGPANALGLSLDGKLYIGGSFTAAGFWTVAKACYWNRQEFYPLGGDGDGLTGGTTVRVIEIDAAGNVYLGGDFTGATNDSLCSYAAIWNGTRFAHLDIEFGAEVLAIAARFGKLFVGYNGASVTSIADVQTVTNEGAAAAYPILDVLGPVLLRYLENQETGKVVRLNLDVQDGERVLVDLRPGYVRAISEVRGNVMYGVMPDSDFGDFRLLPGDNIIAFHATGVGGEEVSLRWSLADWSFDEAR